MTRRRTQTGWPNPCDLKSEIGSLQLSLCFLSRVPNARGARDRILKSSLHLDKVSLHLDRLDYAKWTPISHVAVRPHSAHPCECARCRSSCVSVSASGSSSTAVIDRHIQPFLRVKQHFICMCIQMHVHEKAKTCGDRDSRLTSAYDESMFPLPSYTNTEAGKISQEGRKKSIFS